MKILVTGSGGQLGQHLSRALAKSPWPCTLLTHNELDISCNQNVVAMLNLHTPNIVINAAAYTAVDKAELDPELAHAVNSQGAAYLASAAKSINAMIIHISSDYVFSGDSRAPYKEEDATAPVNVYGLSKYMGEERVAQANPQHIILRTSWLFSEDGSNFFRTMQNLAQTLNGITVVNDQFGGPTYAGDLANTIVKIIRKYQQTQILDWGIYHYCGYPYASWFEFAQVIFAQQSVGHPLPAVTPISSTDYAGTARRPYNSRLNCTKINATFGIEPSDWKSAIKKLSGKPDENH